MENIKIIKYLGEGTFAKTYLCQKDGKLRAIKIFKPRETSKRNIKYIKYETEILKMCCDSKYIVNIDEIHIEPYNSFMTFELLGQSLYEYIKYHKKNGTYIPLLLVKQICRQILYGLIELKNNGILHADLKPENILFQNTDKSNVKIIDLGNALLEQDFSTTTQTIQTRHYRPPECIIKAPFSYAADMWAFGCIVFEMLTNTVLFDPRRDGGMSTNSCHLGMFIKTFGDIPIEVLQSGELSRKYIDLSNNVHKFRYLIGDKYPLYKVFRDFKYSKKESKEFEDFLMKIFVYDPKKRIIPENCLKTKFLN